MCSDLQWRQQEFCVSEQGYGKSSLHTVSALFQFLSQKPNVMGGEQIMNYKQEVCITLMVLLCTVKSFQIRVHLFGFDYCHLVVTSIHQLALFTSLDRSSSSSTSSSSSSSSSSYGAGNRSCLSSLFFEDSRKHTIRHTNSVRLHWKIGRPVAEAITYTTRNKHKRQTPSSSAGFEPAAPEV
jgi:hypothetical protein